MRKILLGVLVAVATLGLIGCTKNENKGKKETKDIYAISAVTSVNNLTSGNTNGMRKLSSTESEKPQFEEHAEHLDLMMSYLNDDTFKVSEKASDTDEYEKLITVEINGKENYQFHYNEKLVKDETKEDEDEIEIEREYKITGIIIKDDITYNVTGKKEIESETEKDEQSEEFSLELKVSFDDKNYTIVKYETESEVEDKETEVEKTYKYKTYVDGKLAYEMKLDFENEDNELELKLEIKDEKNKKESKYELKLDGKKAGKIKYEIDNDGEKSNGTITVEVITDEEGNITYQYK